MNTFCLTLAQTKWAIHILDGQIKIDDLHIQQGKCMAWNE